jgi:hypothetical protein
MTQLIQKTRACRCREGDAHPKDKSTGDKNPSSMSASLHSRACHTKDGSQRNSKATAKFIGWDSRKYGACEATGKCNGGDDADNA